MALDYPILTPNTNSLPQWSDITVTAPSVTPIPEGYYDGTENITANGGSVLTNTSEFNTKVMLADGGITPHDIGFIYWLHQDSDYIYLCGWVMIMDWSLNATSLSVTRYNKITKLIERYEFPEITSGGRSIWNWVWIGVNWNNIHFFSTNVWSGYDSVSFNTTTLLFTENITVLVVFPWTIISWTWIRINNPWSTLFEQWYTSNQITIWPDTIQWIFRFRYWEIAIWTSRKVVSWEWYISNSSYNWLNAPWWLWFYIWSHTTQRWTSFYQLYETRTIELWWFIYFFSWASLNWNSYSIDIIVAKLEKSTWLITIIWQSTSSQPTTNTFLSLVSSYIDWVNIVINYSNWFSLSNRFIVNTTTDTLTSVAGNSTTWTITNTTSVIYWWETYSTFSWTSVVQVPVQPIVHIWAINIT